VQFPDLDREREEMLWATVELWEMTTGGMWPLVDDRRPEVPDSLADLTG
jgi:hypothetical protein